MLVLVIFALTSPRNRAAPTANLGPFFIGFTVAVLISLFAPITQAGWNPAGDFGPRLVAYGLGWGTIAIPGPAGGFWAYIVGPLVGGPLGGLAWQLIGGGAAWPLASWPRPCPVMGPRPGRRRPPGVPWPRHSTPAAAPIVPSKNRNGNRRLVLAWSTLVLTSFRIQTLDLYDLMSHWRLDYIRGSAS